MSLGNPDSRDTSCLCRCGCFLVSIEPDCPICGAMNPVFGNKSVEEIYQEDDGRDEYGDDQQPKPTP